MAGAEGHRLVVVAADRLAAAEVLRPGAGTAREGDVRGAEGTGWCRWRPTAPRSPSGCSTSRSGTGGARPSRSLRPPSDRCSSRRPCRRCRPRTSRAGSCLRPRSPCWSRCRNRSGTGRANWWSGRCARCRRRRTGSSSLSRRSPRSPPSHSRKRPGGSGLDRWDVCIDLRLHWPRSFETFRRIRRPAANFPLAATAALAGTSRHGRS